MNHSVNLYLNQTTQVHTRNTVNTHTHTTHTET